MDRDLDSGHARGIQLRAWSRSASRRSSRVFYVVAPLVAGWFARPLDGRGRPGALCRAAPPGLVPRARGGRALLRGTVAAHGGAAGARHVDRLASRRGWQRVAVLHRGVLRHCHAGRLVGRAPDARTARYGRGHLRRVWPRLARCSGGRPPDIAAAPASVGRRRGAAPRADASLLPVARTGGARGALGAGAAPRYHERRPLHRERRRTPAGRLADRQRPVVDPDDDVVVGSRGKRRRPALARGRRRADARHARRPRVVGAQRGRRRRGGSGAVCARTLSRAHRSSLPAAARDGSHVVAAAMARVRGPGRDDARDERRRPLEPRRDHAHGRYDCGRGRRDGMERWRWRTRVGTDGSAGGGGRQRLRAPVATAGRVGFGRASRSRGPQVPHSSSASCRSSARSTVERCPHSRCCSWRTSSTCACS